MIFATDSIHPSLVRISSSFIETNSNSNSKAHNSHRIVIAIVVTLVDHFVTILFIVKACCGTYHYCMVCHCSFLIDQGTYEVTAFSLVMISWEQESIFSKEISFPNSSKMALNEENPLREEPIHVQVNAL